MTGAQYTATEMKACTAKVATTGRTRDPDAAFKYAIRSFFLQGNNERIGLGNGALHLADQLVDIRLNADHFFAQTGDSPGVEVVLHEQDLVP